MTLLGMALLAAFTAALPADNDEWEERSPQEHFAELQPSGPVTMYFMRHAEGCHNPKDAYSAGHKGPWIAGGWKDPPLTAHGGKQAELAAPTVDAILKTLPGNKFDAVLVSPMKRAQETVLRAFGSHKVKIQVAPNINERVAGAVANSATKALGGEVENMPLAVNQQTCLWGKATKEFPMWANLEQCSLNTCTGQSYNSEATHSGTRAFARWALDRYAGKTIFVGGHSNWAQRRGLGTDGHKVNWASITKVTITSETGWKVEKVEYAGTDKHDASPVYGHTESSKAADSGCPADIANKKACTEE